jgi:hypothetical protein
MSTEHVIYNDNAIIESLVAAGMNQKQAEKRLQTMKDGAKRIKTGGGGNVAKTETGRICALYSANVQTGTDNKGNALYSRKLDTANQDVINFRKQIGTEETLRLGKRLSGIQSGQARAHGTVNADKPNKGANPFLTPNIVELCDAYIEEYTALRNDAKTVIQNANKVQKTK